MFVSEEGKRQADRTGLHMCSRPRVGQGCDLLELVRYIRRSSPSRTCSSPHRSATTESQTQGHPELDDGPAHAGLGAASRRCRAREPGHSGCIVKDYGALAGAISRAFAGVEPDLGDGMQNRAPQTTRAMDRAHCGGIVCGTAAKIAFAYDARDAVGGGEKWEEGQPRSRLARPPASCARTPFSPERNPAPLTPVQVSRHTWTGIQLTGTSIVSCDGCVARSSSAAWTRAPSSVTAIAALQASRHVYSRDGCQEHRVVESASPGTGVRHLQG